MCGGGGRGGRGDGGGGGGGKDEVVVKLNGKIVWDTPSVAQSGARLGEDGYVEFEVEGAEFDVVVEPVRCEL